MIKAYIIDIKKLSEPEVFEKYYQLMPFQRREKIDAFWQKADKMRSLAAGIVLRHGFQAAGLKKEQLWQDKFYYNQHGKPYLKDRPEIQFNLSHAGDYAVAGFGVKELGIDIEQIGRGTEKIAARFFTKGEQTYLKSIIGKEQWDQEFTRLWTCKESFVKAIGTGLSFGLLDIEVLIEEAGKLLINKQYPLWNFYEYKIENYSITICSQEKEADKSLCWVEI